MTEKQTRRRIERINSLTSMKVGIYYSICFGLFIASALWGINLDNPIRGIVLALSFIFLMVASFWAVLLRIRSIHYRIIRYTVGRDTCFMLLQRLDLNYQRKDFGVLSSDFPENKDIFEDTVSDTFEEITSGTVFLDNVEYEFEVTANYQFRDFKKFLMAAANPVAAVYDCREDIRNCGELIWRDIFQRLMSADSQAKTLSDCQELIREWAATAYEVELAKKAVRSIGYKVVATKVINEEVVIEVN